METKKAAIEFFEKKCKEIGIESVNENSVFRWDEVISFMVLFSGHQTTSKQQTIERLRNGVKEIMQSAANNKERYNPYSIEEIEWLSVWEKAEQLLNTTEL